MGQSGDLLEEWIGVLVGGGRVRHPLGDGGLHS